MNCSYSAFIKNFLDANIDEIIGILTQSVARTGIYAQHSKQIHTWRIQVELLKKTFNELVPKNSKANSWHLLLEYEIPRRQKRPDLVVLTDDKIILVEFKVGASIYDASSRWQLVDYAMNLRDFHAESSNRTIIPVLCCTEATSINSSIQHPAVQYVQNILYANKCDLCNVLLNAAELIDNNCRPIYPLKWQNSVYRPTLTIIEAAETLYSNHGVREISHSYADNLDTTTDKLTELIVKAKEQKQYIICFVTGVPGSGKTLTGLNAVHDPNIRSKQGPSGIFLSGNGPLVKVVREALIQNQMRTGRRKADCEHEVTTFIQNVHAFLRYYMQHTNEIPHEHVVVFDEAQRAWGSKQMNRKQGINASEPEILLGIMERLPEWGVFIALVGGGQEIFLGESGLEEWGRALSTVKNKWTVFASSEAIQGGGSVAGHKLFTNGDVPKNVTLKTEQAVHLSVSVRSHRAKNISEWVNDLLELNSEKAKNNVPSDKEFPLYTSRDLISVKKWLTWRSGGDINKRCGLVATSEDQRLRAYGLEGSSGFRLNYPYEKWFLAGPEDVRSSFALEVAASEFECQGLELDWVGVCWGSDLVPSEDGRDWEYRRFRGANWQFCRQESEQAYIRNRYRVLLTRARQGMVIWIPPGKKDDPTLDSSRLDRIHELLIKAGVRELEEIECVNL